MPTTYTLAAGQELQFTQDAELTGSVITADQPIGVWGGASCMNIDVDVAACDAAHQEIPPVKALGNHYAAVRYRNRFIGQEETVPWRIVGAVDGTTLTYSPVDADRRADHARCRARSPSSIARPVRRAEPGRGPSVLHVGAHDRLRDR